MTDLDRKPDTEHLDRPPDLDDGKGDNYEMSKYSDLCRHEQCQCQREAMTYWRGVKRYCLALSYCFSVSLGAMLNGLDAS